MSSFTVSDDASSRLEVVNDTQINGKFVPSIWSFRNADNGTSLNIKSSITSTNDNGTSPVMMFAASINNTPQFGAPTSGDFPWGNAGTALNVINRPVFQWRNNSLKILTMGANGNVGIGTDLPSAKLHSNGSVRFENLSNVTSNTYVLTSDVNGNVTKTLSSSFSGGGLINSCNSLNFIPKKDASGLTCSQIYDNGVNVGIGTTTPANKLTVNGTIQSISNVFISDANFKTNIEPIQGALALVNQLNGKTYLWNQQQFPEMRFGGELQFGLIAQEVETVLPNLVFTSDMGEKALNYTAIIPLLIEAIKDQQSQIYTLQIMLGLAKENNPKNIDDSFKVKQKVIIASPNPSKENIFISIENLRNIKDIKDIKDSRLIVHNLNGVKVYETIVNINNESIKKTLNKDDFGKGIFVVSLSINGNLIDSSKIIFE